MPRGGTKKQKKRNADKGSHGFSRRARLSLGNHVLQHALRAQAVEWSRTISLPNTSITKLLREFKRAHLNEHAVRTSLTWIIGNASESTRASLAGKIRGIENLR